MARLPLADWFSLHAMLRPIRGAKQRRSKMFKKSGRFGGRRWVGWCAVAALIFTLSFDAHGQKRRRTTTRTKARLRSRHRQACRSRNRRKSTTILEKYLRPFNWEGRYDAQNSSARGRGLGVISVGVRRLAEGSTVFDARPDNFDIQQSERQLADRTQSHIGGLRSARLRASADSGANVATGHNADRIAKTIACDESKT